MKIVRAAMGMAVAGALLLAGCGPSNPLIGSWTQTSGGGGCPSSLKFTSDELVSNISVIGPTTMKVTYNVSPKKVYVMTNLGIGGAVGYDIADSSHMSYETAFGTCSYQK